MNIKKDPHKSEVRIPLRQVSGYSAAALLLAAGVFLTGYFFGKKHMAEQFVLKIEQDSFADQIYSSLCALYDQEQSHELVEELSQHEEAVVAQNSNEPEVLSLQELSVQEPKEDSLHAETVVLNEPSPSFYAELIGYGTKKAAESFVLKLCKKDIPAKLKIRESKTADGKKRTWYQVVTELFTSREHLEKLTDRIAREEKIRGICIKSC